MDFLLTGLGKALTIGALLVGFFVFYYIIKPSFEAIQRILKTGKALSWEEQKEMLLGLTIELGKMMFIPILVLTALLISMQISLPAAYEVSDFIYDVIEDLIIELGSDVDTSYSDRVNEESNTVYPTPVAIPTRYIPPAPAPAPAPAPQVIVVTATPIPAPIDLNPSMHPTPTPQRTLP